MTRRREALAAVGIVVVLAACQDAGTRPTALVAAADTADWTMDTVSHYITRQGVRHAYLHADTAYFYDATQSYELRNVRVTFYDAQGNETSTLAAERARYDWRSGSMEARDDVVVVTPDGRRLETEILRYDNANNTIATDQPFRLQRGVNGLLEGRSFQADPEFRNIVTDQPRGTPGGDIPVPGQANGHDSIPAAGTDSARTRDAARTPAARIPAPRVQP